MENFEKVISETIPQCAFCVDRYGHLRYFNLKFASFVKENFDHPVRLGEVIVDVLSPKRRALWNSRLQEVFSGTFLRVEEVLDSEYGARYFDVIYHPLIENSRCEHAMVYFEEITVRRRRELRLLDVETNLQETIATRETLLSVISHDLRSPIFQLNGLLYNIRLSSEQRDESRVRLLADDLEDRIAHLTHTLDNLLSWSNLNRQNLNPKVAKFSLEAVLDHALGLLKPHAMQKGVRISCTPISGLRMNSDQEMVAFVARNLINNAIKFSREGDTVEVRIEQADGSTLLEVVDNGIGMDEAQLASLKEQHRLESDTGTWGERGTGLGLSLCYEFIQRLNGTIDIQSKKEKGTRITVRLPDF